MKTMLGLVLALAFALPPPAWSAEKILIGQSAPLSGSNAEIGKDIREGALAYFKKVNDAGGVNGKQVELLTLDDNQRPVKVTHGDARPRRADVRKLAGELLHRAAARG